jgi:hypothetical protein
LKQALDIDPVPIAANHNVKIKILEQGPEAIENPLPGIEQDLAVGLNMVKVGEMLHYKEKTDS